MIRWSHRTRLWKAGCALAFSSWVGPQAWGQTAELPEYQLKAAFIYNFAKFVTWPEGTFQTPKAPFVIAILGEDPFGTTLSQTLAGKSVNGHPIDIIYLAAEEPIGACHILFISSSEKDRLVPILERIAGRPILTVGDFDRFAHRGGMINLYMEAKAIRFRINANATDQGQFKVSSKLGGLGIVIRGDVVGGAP